MDDGLCNADSCCCCCDDDDDGEIDIKDKTELLDVKWDIHIL